MARMQRKLQVTLRVEFGNDLNLGDLRALIEECDEFADNSTVTLRAPSSYPGEPGVVPGHIEIRSVS